MLEKRLHAVVVAMQKNNSLQQSRPQPKPEPQPQTIQASVVCVCVCVWCVWDRALHPTPPNW